MNKTLLVVRIVFIALCVTASWLLCYTIQEWDDHRVLAMVIGLMIGVLVVLVDVMLKGFSLRAFSSATSLPCTISASAIITSTGSLHSCVVIATAQSACA